jgi:galactokinase
MKDNLEQKAIEAFAATFGGAATISARAPGRVELLGNHTDYNGGLVLAAAIDRETVVVGRPKPLGDRSVRVRSLNLDQTESFDLSNISQGEPGSWGRYVRGATWVVQDERGPIETGFDAVIAGDVPLGAGLSSSASAQVAVALFALRVMNGDSLVELNDDERMNLARAVRRAENEFVGVNAGLLDPFTSLFGRQGCAVMLDCKTLEYQRVPLGESPPAIVVCDTGTSRKLADGMYNRRRDECERIVAHFARERGDQTVKSLRDIALADLESAWESLDDPGRSRARHVLTENDRVQAGAQALVEGDLQAFGTLMSASHASSRDDFENSSHALDAMIKAASLAPGFIGGKLSGAGWAGCAVALVEADKAAAFVESVEQAYRRSTGLEPKLHVCRAAEGASSRTLP